MSTWTLVSGTYLQKVAIGPTNQFMVAIQYSPSGNTVIYSRDFGATWTPSTGITGNANCISSTGQYVLVGVNSVASNLYYSSDYGTSFTTLPNSPSSYWTVVGISQYSSSTMVACDYSGDTATVYYSTNTGYSWSTLNSYSGVIMNYAAWSNTDNMTSIYLVGFMTSFPYSSSLYKTNDTGATWSTISDISSYTLQGVACDQTGQYVVVSASQDGVYRSIDYGSSWYKTTAPSAPPSGSNMGSIACDMKGEHIIVMDTSVPDIYASEDGGVTWTLQTTTGSNTASDIFPVSMSPDGSYRFVSFLGLGLYSNVVPVYQTVNFSNNPYNPLIYVSCNNYSGQHMVAIGSTQYGQGKCIVYSADYGLTWNLSDADSSGDSVFTCLATSANGRYVVAGFQNGPNGVVFSNNYGVHFSIVTTGLDFIPSAITISDDGQLFYATTTDGSGAIYVGYLTGSVVAMTYGVPGMYWKTIKCDSTGANVYATAQDDYAPYYLYKTHVIMPDIYFPMNNNLTDAMGNSTITPYGTINFVSGISSQYAMSLTNTVGIDAYNYIRGSITSDFTTLTVSFWMNLQSDAGSDYPTIFATCNNSIIIYLYPGTNVLNVGFPSTNTVNNIDTSFAITRDTWYHIQIVFQVGTCYVFVNNHVVGTTTSTGRGSFSGTEFSMGCYNNNTGQSFTGYIDDLKIYYSADAYGVWSEVPHMTSSPLLPLYGTCDSTGQVVTLAAGTDGVYQSVDSAKTWTTKNSLTAGAVPSNPNTFTAIQDGLSGFHWSTNNIAWEVSASTYQNGQFPYIPFRETISDSWNTTAHSYTPSGNNSGIMSTFYTNGSSTVTVEGDWLQLRSSIPLVLYSHQIGCGNSNNLPTMFYIVGSNDGNTWYAIQYAAAASSPFDAVYQLVPGTILTNYNGSQTWGNTTLTTTAYDGSTKAYTYFRIILLSSFYSPGTCAQLGKWITNFEPTAVPVIELPLTDSVLDRKNVSAVTPYGTMAYLSGGAVVNTINLVNTVGATPANYIRGTCTAINGNFNLSIKFNPQTFDAGTQPIIFGMGSTSNTVFQLVMDSATTLSLQIFDSNTSWHVFTLGTMTANTWYNVYVNYQKTGTISIYLNDALVASSAGFSLYVPADNISIGTYTHETSGAFNGYVSDIKIDVEDVPFIRLFDSTVKDLLNNATMTTYGNISYLTNISETYALNLSNTVGDNSYQATNYVRGSVADGMTSFTVSGWFNIQAGAGNAYPTIFSMYSEGILMFYNPGSNSITLHVPTGSGSGQNSINGPGLTIGEWYSFMIVYQIGTCQFYLNNTLIGTTTSSGLGSFGSTTFSLGCYDSATGQPSSGYFSDFRIYNTALTPPSGHSLTMIAGDASGSNLVVGDTNGQIVFRSMDAGATWAAQIIDGTYTNAVQNVSIDPTGTYAFASYNNYNVFMSQRSSGLTTSWTVTNGEYYPVMTFSNDNVHQVAINSLYQYNSSNDSIIYYSSNSGSTWTASADLGGWVNSLASDSTGQYVVALVEIDAVQPSVYRSTDYGATFNAVSGSPDYNTYGTNCIACDSTGQKIYVGSYSGDVFVSHNSGATWTRIPQSYDVVGISCSYSGQYVFANLDGSYLAVSNDYGITWSSNIIVSPDYGNSQIISDWSGQFVVAACYNDGVYRSTDYGQTWTKTSAPSDTSIGNSNYYYNIACNSTGNRIITMDVNNSTIYLSTDAGATWTLQYTPGSQVSEAFIGVSVSPDGTHYSTGFYAPGTFFLTAGSPDIPAVVPCFLEGTQILCQVNGVEEYKAVETIRPGMLVKTSRDGYVPVKLIGSRSMTNPGTADRHKNSLYVCSKSKYPELTADLTITGCHAILVDKITEVQRAGIIQTLDRIFVTDRRYRLPACVDERTDVLQVAGDFTVWHFALEHHDIRMNFGVYAQGLLVESSPICHMNSKNYTLVQ